MYKSIEGYKQKKKTQHVVRSTYKTRQSLTVKGLLKLLTSSENTAWDISSTNAKFVGKRLKLLG